MPPLRISSPPLMLFAIAAATPLRTTGTHNALILIFSSFFAGCRLIFDSRRAFFTRHAADAAAALFAAYAFDAAAAACLRHELVNQYRIVWHQQYGIYASLFDFPDATPWLRMPLPTDFAAAAAYAMIDDAPLIFFFFDMLRVFRCYERHAATLSFDDILPCARYAAQSAAPRRLMFTPCRFDYDTMPYAAIRRRFRVMPRLRVARC